MLLATVRSQVAQYEGKRQCQHTACYNNKFIMRCTSEGFTVWKGSHWPLQHSPTTILKLYAEGFEGPEAAKGTFTSILKALDMQFPCIPA